MLIEIIIVGLASLSLVWLFFGRRVCLSIDRLFLRFPIQLEFSPSAINRDRFALGSRTWPFPRSGTADPKVDQDVEGRLVLSVGGKIIVLGPITKWWAGDPLAEYAFEPDSDDSVSFTLHTSRLCWPRPFNFSLMGIKTSKWRRHAYRRLLWKKASGATLEIIWRDEQWYYVSRSWADQYVDQIVRLRIAAK